MPNSTLGNLTAATAGTGGLFYGIQSNADRKFTLTAAGASLIEAANASAQAALLPILSLTGGTLTGSLTLPNTIFTGLSLTGSQATNTIDVSTTWNTTGNPTLIYGRATNIASGASSNLLDLGTVAGGSLLKIDKAGTIISGGVQQVLTSSSSFCKIIGANWLFANAANPGTQYFYIEPGQVTIAQANGTLATTLNSAAAATLQLGVNHLTTPTTQTLKAHNVTTGNGADLVLKGGTGSVANGSVSFGTYTAGTSANIGYITIKDEGGTVRKLAVVA
jgi:hypothetical protein